MTLFEKYGGVATVSRIVSKFYREVMNRPTLQPYFQGVDMTRLINHQVKFISHVLGQPASVYEGRAPSGRWLKSFARPWSRPAWNLATSTP